MSFQLKSNNPFDGHGILQSKRELHSFACRNTEMVNMNLSVFSLGSLKAWVGYQRNRYLINKDNLYLGDDGNITEKGRDRISQHLIANDYLMANINVWRVLGRNGTYEEILKLDEWTYDRPDGKKYTWSDVISVDLPGYQNSDEENSEETSDLDPERFITLYLIDLNDFIQDKLAIDPIVKEDFNWSHEEIAAYEFFTDVNSSKERCISWSQTISIARESIVEIQDDYLNLKPKKTKISVQYEDLSINLRLYFFSSKNKRKTERKVGTKELNIVSPKSNMAGQQYIAKDEGKIYYATTQEDPRSHAGAPVDIKYTEFLNKWESGTPQVIAIMTTDLPAVEKPDLSVFVDGNPKDILHHETGLGVFQGSAIPLSMDKCNPLQWCPSFSMDERLRLEDDKSKHEVKVYNISDATGFASGDIVILNRIDGVWIPMPFVPGQVAPLEPFLGQWEFTYLMTNSDYFFKNYDADGVGRTITYKDYEEGLHKIYYDDDNLNQSYYENANVFNGQILDGFFQTTSWDFMGSGIGGLRDKNALACTQFGYYPDNEPIGPNEGKESLGISGPFFGCVFPDGYHDSSKINELKSNDKPFDIKQTGAVSAVSKEPQIFHKDIPWHQNVFENNNSNTTSSSRGGMFVNNINQLPADIALNSSPHGIYGRPICSICDLKTNINTKGETQRRFGEYFRNIRDYLPGEISNKVPARYSWLYKKPTGIIVTTDYTNDSAFDLKPQNIKKIQFRPLKTETYACYELENKYDVDVRSEERGEFARRMWDTQNDDKNPISVDAFGRNIINFNPFNIGDSHYTPLFYGSHGLIYENSVKYPPDKGDNNPDLLWDRDWIGVGTNNQGNAFGIIGAACNVTFDKKIEFVTDNYIGMQPWFQSNFLYPSWGKGSYNSAHTTNLSVRCFQSWPRDQTIYDARYFAVHHFNDGVEKQITIVPNETENIEYLNEIKVSGLITSVDFLEVYNNLFSKVNSNTNIESGVNYSRRGKLLPYNYQYKTIGIGPFVETITTSSGKLAKDSNIFIKNAGEGYSQTDRFIVSGGNGEGVLLSPVLQNGHIINFDIIRHGYNFLKEDFISGDTKLNYDTTSSITIEPSGEVSGQGLDAIIVGGCVVTSPVLTDERPKELFFRKISADPITDAGLNQIADSVNEISLKFGQELDESDKTKDNTYNLFFFFQNDISHTWDWDRGALPPAYEQKIDLTINLDPDS